MHDSLESRRANIDKADATIDFGTALYRLKGPQGYRQALRCQVIPAGREFFHVREMDSGRTLGFRCSHLEACALARLLEQGQRPLKDFVAVPIQ
ncbi:hypothetical protein PMM47T1_21003 [Pseudomonas sp. M47T1]|uniref:hypothetical protein n=1 Tax=unclassified Pseudomonas TaxID=196821 RepID=UPI000260761C|nr:hypothetical protein [Pseudomonas sp. M47T1]EIK94608.1 hypothetical protein PMM47T1_21003 [Pseudomonas sp. M47T1]